jgi:acetolactate synthase-1/2/3 large subunit
VDIDASELHKPTLNIDCPIHCDVGIFMQELLKQHDKPLSPKQEWLAYCNRIKKQYPVVLEDYRSITDYVSSYVFPEVLSEYLDGSEIIVTANGTIYTSTYQAIRLKDGNRMFANEGCASMGYGLPAAIGAAVASPNRSIICLTGDGSIQMNLQELQTIINHRLPIKIFMYNNQGYLSIKITQKSFFNGHFVGSTPESGVQLPDMKKIAAAYGYPVETIENHDALRRKLPHILNKEGPVFCEIKTDPSEILGPKAATRQMADGRLVSLPLEDLSPFLSRDEFIQNMLIEPIIENEESLTE